MPNSNPTEAQLALNLSPIRFVLKENQPTQTVKKVIRLLSDQDFSDQEIRKLGNNQEFVPFCGGWLLISASNPQKERNRYRWDIFFIPHAIL